MAEIKYIASYVPDKILGNDEIVEMFPKWSKYDIYEKTGIQERRIAAFEETAGDMAVKASQKLITKFG